MEAKADDADLDVGEFEEKDGAKERSLKYVMHMVRISLGLTC